MDFEIRFAEVGSLTSRGVRDYVSDWNFVILDFRDQIFISITDITNNLGLKYKSEIISLA